MHDKLFANQQNLKRPDLEKYAQEIGLDMGKFKEALDKGTGKARIAADMAAAKQIGVQGTPNFVHQRPQRPGRAAVRGVQEGDRRGDRLRQQADRQGDGAGQGLRDVHGEGEDGTAAAPDAAKPQPPQKAPGAGNEVYKLALVDAPSKGAKQPKVTIVEFSEFQCPFCSRVNPTIAEVLKTYGNDVQVQFRHNPLPFHNNAMIASLAGEAAREQGKFWEMHDKMFANQQALERANLEKYAEEIGLNMGKFKAALDAEKGKDRIKRDMDDAAKFGARGTPNFFINGRNLRGAQPIEAFKATIDEEIKKADAKLASGTPRGQLYAALTKEGLDKAAPPPAQPGAPDANTRFRADVKGAPVEGRQGRAGDDRPVLGLPVPVLQPRRADDGQDPRGVQGQGPRRVARPAAPLPQQRDARRDRGARRR